MRRILPLTIVAVFLVLPLKLGFLSEALPAIAEQIDREFGAHDRPWAADVKAEADAAAKKAEAENKTAAPPPAAPLPPENAKIETATCEDPALRAAIEEQRSDLLGRSRHVVEAEAVLAVTEARTAAQIDKLTGIRKDIEALLRQRSNLQQEDLKRMVSIYEAMKPRDAARIFSTLETSVVVDLLDRMQERRSAPILAELEDTKARDVTQMVLQRRMLPADRASADRAARTAATN